MKKSICRECAVVLVCIVQTLCAQEENIKALTPPQAKQHVIYLLKMSNPYKEFNLFVENDDMHEAIYNDLFLNAQDPGEFYGLEQNTHYIELNIDNKPGMLFCGANYYPGYSMMAYAPFILDHKNTTTSTWATLTAFYGLGSRQKCMNLIESIKDAYLDRYICDKILITSQFLSIKEEHFFSLHKQELKRTFIYEEYSYHERICGS